MHTFNKKKQENNGELILVQVPQNKKYDFFAALAKALLLFLLVFGALGGFLAAFEIDYNKGLCMLVLFAISLVLAAAYETGKRWITNLLSIVFFMVYLLVAILNYWLINSGYYAIMNRVFEVAREYLNITGGVEYSVVVEDAYSTVTIFVIFIGMVGVILLNIQMQSKCSLLKLMLLTFTPYVVPFYLNCNPPLIYILFLLAGYVTAAVLQNSNAQGVLTKQMKYILPLAVLFVVVVVRLVAFIIPQEQYISGVRDSSIKESTKEEVGVFAQYGMRALFQNVSNGAGMSGGILSKSASTMPTYETDLRVRFTPYNFDGVYLKAFTGKQYYGDMWSRAVDSGNDDGRMFSAVQSRKQTYEQDPAMQAKAVMEVEYVGADTKYEYRPYYTDYDLVKQQGNVYTYTYYPAGTGYDMDEEIDRLYLSVPTNCSDAVEKICADAGFAGTPEEIALQITQYFDENYSYTLNPGFYFGNPDYISYFLLDNKKGYCSHFASAGTMLFRQMDIPARYVEGYAFSYLNVVEDGLLVEGADYADYYDGISELGETALVEMEIPDAYAHAWVEIYIEGKGWVVVDPTPASEEQDTTSFWDAFMTIGDDIEVPEIGQDDLGEYIETALSGTGIFLLGAAIIFLIIVFVANMLRIKRERAMGGRERVQLEYSRLQQCLVRKNNANKTLQTIAEQINCMRMRYELEVTTEQENALYQVYFAPQVDYNCEQLRKELVALRKKLRTQKENKKY